MQNMSRKSFLGIAAGTLAFAGLGSMSLGSIAVAEETSEGGAAQVTVTLEDNECIVDVSEVPAGPVTFTIQNVSSPAISEFELLFNKRIIGEKENLAPGLPPVSFTKTLGGGEYELYIPGAVEPYLPFTVTGELAAAPEGSIQDILAKGVEDYAAYVYDQIEMQLEECKKLDEAIQAGDMDAAIEAYASARPYYERAESAVEGFMMPEDILGEPADPENSLHSLDYLIDMRASSLDEEAGWHGFHAIERDLFEAGEITDATRDYSTELVENVTILFERVVPTFAEDLRPEDLANGAADLLEEVSTGKIEGEEEEFCHLDLLDFRANVEGAEQAFACLRDGLLEIDEELVATIEEQFQVCKDTVDEYRDPDSLGGFLAYTEELMASDAPKLSAVILPLHDSIAQLAEKVATA